MKTLLCALLLSQGAVVPFDAWWGPGPHWFSVSFEQLTPAPVRRTILATMNQWHRCGNVFFYDVTPARGLVRVALNTGEGNWSYVGRQTASITEGPTMWLDGIASVADAVYQHGAILHETGHVLGLEHEHERPELFWRIKTTYDYYSWLDPPLDLSRCWHGPPDPASVMCWYVPPNADRLRKGFGGGDQISYWDARLIAALYPKK